MPDPTTRDQHMADMAAIAEEVVAENGPLGTPTAFAVLRDIADGNLIYYENPAAAEHTGWSRCVFCVSRHLGAGPFPHLISCPWARAVQIVGVKTDA